MHARMKNPAAMFPDALQAIQSLKAIIDRSGLATATRNLVQLRASQINRSSSCIDAASKQAQEDGETDVRLLALAAWRASPYYTAAERAALALTEVVTRLDSTYPVRDEIWQEITTHFDEPSLAAIFLTIAITNASNRFNVSVRQMPGT